MAITLTKNYQLISTIPLTYGEIRTYAKYNNQDKVNNNTSYNLLETYYLRQWIEVSSWNTNLDGKETNGGYTRFNAGETGILEVTRTITHNNDGSSPTKSVYTGWNATFGGTGEVTADIKMPKIARIPTITLADSFNDESNPTIEFTNPANFVIKPTLDFCYTTDTTKVLHSITRDTSITSPYIFDFSNDEREELRSKLNDKKEYVVRYNLNTYDENGAYIGKASVDRTFTFINAEPTFTSSFQETDTNVIKFLGSSAEKIIKNASKVKTTIVPTALKGASIKSVEIIHGSYDVILTKNPYEQILTALTNTFEIIVTDSRDYVVKETITKDLIDYSPIEISQYLFKRVNPTSSDIVLNATIKYNQQTFDTTTNVPTIQWKLGDDGELNTLSNDDYSIDNNEIIINNLLLENVLPYTQQGKLYLLVNDLLTSDAENQIVIVGIPVFDYGEFDLQVNGELFIADRNRQNAKSILDFAHPIGSYYETSDVDFNPNTYWGGTWELDSKGLVTVSLDEEDEYFNEIGKTGGSKYLQKHNHKTTKNTNATAKGAILNWDNNTSGSYYGYSYGSSSFGSSGAYALNDLYTGDSGTGESGNLQPYIVVNRWHRTA